MVGDSASSSVVKDSDDVEDPQQFKKVDQQKIKTFKNTDQRRQRQFRSSRRSTSSSDSEEEKERTASIKRHDISNQKIIEHLSNNSNSSDSEREVSRKARKEEFDSGSGDEKSCKKSVKDDSKVTSKNKTVPSDLSEKEDLRSSDSAKDLDAAAAKEKLIALFTKRHVGEIYDDARERYLKRKESRQLFPLVIDTQD